MKRKSGKVVHSTVYEITKSMDKNGKTVEFKMPIWESWHNPEAARREARRLNMHAEHHGVSGRINYRAVHVTKKSDNAAPEDERE